MGTWPQACSLKGWPTRSLPGMEPPPGPSESLALPQCPDQNACCSSAGRWGAGRMVAGGMVYAQVLPLASEDIC